jgi:putative ABC transport system permease protein
MIGLAYRLLLSQRSHFGITIAGIAVTFALMILLVSVHEGVKEGATGYIVSCGTDIWVTQDNSTNILRSSSFLRSTLAPSLTAIHGIRDTRQVLRVLTTATIHADTVTVFLLGVDASSPTGSPSGLVEGKTLLKQGAVVIDRAFATRHGLAVGDSISIQHMDFVVAGISSGTNAIVTQLTFCTVEDARKLLGFPGICSFYQVRVDAGIDPQTVAARIQAAIPGVNAFTREQFRSNTLRELETGLLPVLWTIAMLGIGAGAIVITLLLYGSIVVRRHEYALLKAIGTGRRHLYGLVNLQALLVSGAGAFCGIGGALILSPLLSVIAPELSVRLRQQDILILAGGALCMALAGAIAPTRALAGIDPEEVFRS